MSPLPLFLRTSRPLLAAFCLVAAFGVARPVAADVIVASEFVGTLQEAVDAAGIGGHLIVDGHYQLTETLVLPQQFRLSGISPQGAGILEYLPTDGVAIQVAPETAGHVTIENLDIEGQFIPDSGVTTSARGIEARQTHFVTLRNLTVRGFSIGVVARWSFYGMVDNCNVSVNQDANYSLSNNANSWRITGGSSSQAGNVAIRVRQSNHVVIDSVVFESDPIGIDTDTEATHILNNRFECWPGVTSFCDNGPVGVLIGVGASRTTLMSNLYAGVEPVVDQSFPSTTYRVDNGFGAAIRPGAGEEGLRIELADDAGEMVLDETGALRLGPEQGVSDFLTVNAPAGESPMRVRTDGVTRLYVSQAGRVGVGTSVPAETLHVNGDLRVDGDIVTTGALCIGSGC